MPRLVAASLSLVVALLCASYTTNAAIYIVTKTADTGDSVCDKDCSLREAVLAANATAENDIVVFALPLFSSPQTITLSGGEILTGNGGSLAIYGPGANRLTVSGNNASRIFRSMTGSNVTISGMRLTGGNGVSTVNNGSGGAILNDVGTMTLLNLVVINNNTSGSAGGIRNSGTNSVMTINRCVIANNSSATSSAGGVQNFSTSTLTVLNSTFTGNVSGGGTVGGGAIQANGSVTITNSTFVGNTSNTTGGGGAINSNGSLLLLTNVTITGNTATGNAGGLHRGTTNVNGFLRNSIIAGNTGAAASPDVTHSTGGLDSLGNNIIGVVGTSTGWEASDQQNVDPLLAPLGFYGGVGMTRLPLAASPAINMGDNCVLNASCPAQNAGGPITTDQRGVVRPSGANVDVGAVEASGNYSAMFPSAVASVPYSFTVVPASSGFTYLLNSGTFGGLELASSTSVVLSGTAPVPGVYNGLVQMVGSPGQAFQNYHINVLPSANSYAIIGRVVTSAGDPVSRAYVTLDGLNGSDFNAITNGFGYFRVEGVPGGWTGNITVASKRGITFAPQTLTVYDVTEDLEIRASL